LKIIEKAESEVLEQAEYPCPPGTCLLIFVMDDKAKTTVCREGEGGEGREGWREGGREGREGGRQREESCLPPSLRNGEDTGGVGKAEEREKEEGAANTIFRVLE
jgi:hypothetical protein